MSRSEQMACIKGRHTSPERRLRSSLWAVGLRYRLHAKTPAGRPDLVFPGQRVAVFIDGCFWHGCPDHYVTPRTRRAFWAEKLAANVERDQRQTRNLEALGWRVVRLWECEIDEDLERVVAELAEVIREDGCQTGLRWRVRESQPLDAMGDRERRHLVDLRNILQLHMYEGARNSRSGPRSSILKTSDGDLAR